MLPEPRTAQGRAGLAALLARPGDALVALDYDGTLAPVVARPQDAVPQPGAVEVLRRLSRVVGLALVTGRPVDVVLALTGLSDLPDLQVLGQYGSQHWRAGRLTAEPAVPGLARARTALPLLVRPEGAQVEDKGLSLVVHTRRAPDPSGALVRLRPAVEQLAAGTGLQVHPGRLVLELRAPGHDKGTAVGRLLPGRSAVLYAGDDLGDLPAYDEIDRAREDGVPGLLVCSDSEETPAALRERADLVVPGPAGVVALLVALADVLSG